MAHFSEQLTRSGTTIKECKRNTCVTKENFQNMYENVYEAMVKAGIADEKEEEIEYETSLPSRSLLTKPEFLLFVDETGCNTNQLNDGRVGGELFVVPNWTMGLVCQLDPLWTCTSQSLDLYPVLVRQ
jgi:hypothetical protein